MTSSRALGASSLVVALLCGCGPLEEPTRLPAAPGVQTFALTSSSTDGWSLDAHAAAPAEVADLALNATGCRGGLSMVVLSNRLSFCNAGSGFASVHDVPALGDCASTSSFAAGGAGGVSMRGEGYSVFLSGAPFGRLRVADHTQVPGMWQGEPVQVTLEFTASATP